MSAAPLLKPEGGFVQIQKNDLYAAMRRFQPVDVVNLLYIACETTSHADRPEYADIPGTTWRKYTGLGERAISLSLERLEAHRAVVRQFPDSPTHRGGYKIDWRAVHAAPVREARRRKCRPREAEVKAPRLAAARNGFAGFSPDAGDYPVLQLNAESAAQVVDSKEPDIRQKPFSAPALSADSPPPVLPTPPAPPPLPAPQVLYLITEPVPPAPSRQELVQFRIQLQNILQPGAALPVSFCPIGLACPYFLEEEELKKKISSGGRAFSGVVEKPADSPARPVEVPLTQIPPSKRESPAPPEWHARLRGILKGLPIGTHLDEPMFQRIASHLSAELLDQFETAAKAATGIRKWPGYEDIARQVAARGVVNAAAAATGGGPERRGMSQAMQEAYARMEAQRAGRGGKP